jgi:hypothetical protein
MNTDNFLQHFIIIFYAIQILENIKNTIKKHEKRRLSTRESLLELIK